MTARQTPDPFDQLDDDIEALERDIAARKGSLPYVDRGYFDKQRKIEQMEARLRAMKRLRDHAAG